MDLGFLPGRVGKILRDVGKGNVIVLRQRVQKDYDPREEQTAASAFTEYSCEGIITNPKRGLKAGGSEEAAACRVLLRADTLAVTPAVGDTLVVNGKEWTVSKVDPVEPAGTAILHKLECMP